MTGSTLVFDIETNGLLNELKTIHCLGIYEIETKQYLSYNDTGNAEPIVRGLQRLADATCIIGHNVIGYDIVAIQRLYQWFQHNYVIDTVVMSRCLFPDLLEDDKQAVHPHMPLQLYGRHSLEAWGHRLGNYKGHFAKETDWQDWSQDMEDYMETDVAITNQLWEYFRNYLNGYGKNMFCKKS